MLSTRNIARLLMVLAVASLVLGIVFVVQGITKDAYLKEAMRQENVTLGLPEDAVARGEVIDSLDKAEKAADTVREHRRGVAPSYNELLGEGRFDPTNPQHLTYAQAMNLENYLYLAVAAFGLTMLSTASGVFMIIIGFAVGGIGLALNRIS